ncbi:MAG: hypothetical protein CVU35_05090 [Betaproteobacteria bacterium HGW-Betaproteobacteria-8]|nr:MAG: hypothetical protein CVU35_05090 [Betaproteobacteria bacterium HGW-Betaproteobacteria-8]
MWQFVRANLAYMLSGKLRSKKGYQPPGGHHVPADFVGVGVATAEDPAVDDAVIGYLNELGIRQIRLDFTYGDADNHVARFLEKLIANDFNIMLHLVQPFAAAKAMQQVSAQGEWGNFVTDTLERFGSRIEILEIGSTINRKRWAGYTLDGFLNAWGIAHKAAKPRNIKLAGPNITDFEPPYNIGILAILKSRDQLPDIHTDNLFSERCTEPERDDHKILGHRLAPLGGFRLVKKAFVLQEIGENFGVPELHSPAAFWTLPRIHRVLAGGEQKQADYLARYMLLCAASGALQRASWGPMICHREGLIDDGVKAYPKLERITHYASVLGNTFRVRPAFKAFKTFASLIPGSYYEACLDDANGLEVHAFSNQEQLIHAAWTINGRAAALRDIYSESDLQQATCLNRDGETLPQAPDFVTESPVYLCWPKGRQVSVNHEAQLIPDLALHAHAEKTHYLYRKDNWHGAILAKDAKEEALLRTGLNPDVIGSPPEEAILRKARNAIWTIPDPRDPAKKLVIKQPVRMHPHKKLLDRFKPSKGLRSWNGASELLRRGVETARPVAYFEKTGDITLTQNYYICEYVEADFSARDIFSAFAAGETNYQGISQEEAYSQLADYLSVMHGRGVFFRDLSGGNILVKKAADGKLAFSLIDTGRAHFYLRGTELSKRISDLTRICNKLHAAGRDRFMQIYMARLAKKFGFYQRLPFYLYNAKVSMKRKLKAKELKRLFKR